MWSFEALHERSVEMKVQVSTFHMPPDNWEIELVVDDHTTIEEFKRILCDVVGGPRIGKSTRVLYQGRSSTMYSLQDREKVKKRMMLTDPSQADSKSSWVSTAEVNESDSQLELQQARQESKVVNRRFPGHAVAHPPQQVSSRMLPKHPPKHPPQAAPKASDPSRPLQGMVYPSFPDLELSMRHLLLQNILSPWSLERHKLVEAKAAGKDQVSAILAQMLDAVRKALERYDGREPFHPLTEYVARDFTKETPDLMAPNVHRVPNVLHMQLGFASRLVGVLGPVAERHGFGASIAGVVAMMDATSSNWSQNPEACQLLAEVQYLLFFGLRVPQDPGATYCGHLLWTTWMMGVNHPMCIQWAFLHHLALPPLDRRLKSYPRTVAYVEVFLEAMQQAMHRSSMKEATQVPRRRAGHRVTWIFGATDELEGRLARQGHFEEAGVFKSAKISTPTVYLISRKPLSGNWPSGTQVKVHSATMDDVASGQVPIPSQIGLFNSGLGTLEPAAVTTSLPLLLEALRPRCFPTPIFYMTSRSEAEAKTESAMLEFLHVRGMMSYQEDTGRSCLRNAFSAMAGSPDVDFDDNGWVLAGCGSGLPEEKLNRYKSDPQLFLNEFLVHMKEREPLQPRPADGEGPGPRSPAVFWGILDLKYDPNASVENRVKVLETGDGRSSRFSGYGAAIKETFEHEHKLQETIRRAVMVENKKLFHDIIVENEYTHLRPRQLHFPKVHTPDLADRIKQAFDLNYGDVCILKLVNRCRGAGVVPVCAQDLDATLAELLCPPDNMKVWCASQRRDWPRTVEWGCYEEQVRHWWSNECPCFLVEDFCRSAPTEREGSLYDGTMRVGFSLHREDRDRLPPGYVLTEDGPVQISRAMEMDEQDDAEDHVRGEQALDPWGDPRLWLDLYRQGSAIFRIQWLGGYWKLPVESVDSANLRSRIVSVAKKGTAAVDARHLHDVYASLGDMVPVVFNTQNMSHMSLLRRYSDFPELGSFITTRLACSMRARDKQRSMDVLQLAQTHIAKLSGKLKDVVNSYIHRNLGVFEAGHGKWGSAADYFRRSLEDMPANATSLYLLGMHYLEVGSAKAAIEVMEESLFLDPDFKAPYVNIACARLQMGDYSEALEVSRAGLNRHPQTVPALYNLGVAAYVLALRAERSQNVTHQDLRRDALGALTAARDGRTKEQVWTPEDDLLVERLTNKSRLLPRAHVGDLPKDGWRSYGWRP